jgi:cytochrome c-type biogenesis protein CcmH
MGRAADAVKARENILRLEGPNAVREADLGEALVAAQNGLVDAQARAAFTRALAHNPEDARAKFYLDLAAQQAEAGKR